MACVKDPPKLGKTALRVPRLLSSFTHLSTLKYLNSAILLILKVNILRVNFSQISTDSSFVRAVLLSVSGD